MIAGHRTASAEFCPPTAYCKASWCMGCSPRRTVCSPTHISIDHLFLRIFSMFEVSPLPVLCRILRRPPASSLAFGCPSPKLIVDRCVRASNPCGYGAKRESFVVKCLYCPIVKGKVPSRFTNSLRCNRMGVIHSDCFFADVL